MDWQKYEAGKKFVQARCRALFGKVPDYQIVCGLEIRPIIAFDAFYEGFVSNPRISRVPCVTLPVSFGENASAIKSQQRESNATVKGVRTDSKGFPASEESGR